MFRLETVLYVCFLFRGCRDLLIFCSHAVLTGVEEKGWLCICESAKGGGLRYAALRIPLFGDLKRSVPRLELAEPKVEFTEAVGCSYDKKHCY